MAYVVTVNVVTDSLAGDASKPIIAFIAPDETRAKMLCLVLDELIKFFRNVPDCWTDMIEVTRISSTAQALILTENLLKERFGR